MIFYNVEGDIVFPERRKNKNDEKAKREYNRYKRGGHNRVNEKKEKEE